jgi:glyoxylase-like metal-dependent hydrolase (beta-lactamase superfamily II)
LPCCSARAAISAQLRRGRQYPVDDQFAPLSDKIAAAVATLDRDPVRFVINTHWHFDHTGGNENFGKSGR